jgi:hypothetical protein
LVRIQRETGRTPDLPSVPKDGQAEAFASYAIANLDWYPEQGLLANGRC